MDLGVRNVNDFWLLGDCKAGKEELFEVFFKIGAGWLEPCEATD